MHADPVLPVDPNVVTVSLPPEAVAGSTFDFDIVVRNLGTVAATQVRCVVESAAVVSVAFGGENDAAIVAGATVVVPLLAAGGIVRLRATATVADDAPSTDARIAVVLTDACGPIASLARTIAVTARNARDFKDAHHDRLTEPNGDRDETFEPFASIEASVVDVVPGVPVSWTIVARLAGGVGDDYAIEVQALGCDIDRGSMRAIVGDATIAIPTSRRGGSILARVAALCALDRLVLVCDGIVAAPHVAGAAIAVEATIARADRSIAARTTANVRSAPRFACIPEAIAPLDPLTAGSTARVAFALVNIGTASANGVRVSGSVEGAEGAHFTLAKSSRDDLVPARTESIEGRLVVPAPLRDGTLLTLTALVAANGCETTSVRRVVAIRSAPAFSSDSSSVVFDDEAPLRPNASRTIVVVLVNEGTDRADDLRLSLAVPPWLVCGDATDPAGAVLVIPSLAAGERREARIEARALSEAPVGAFRVPAELSWNGGRFALAVLSGMVETHAAFADAGLAVDDDGDVAREPDDAIAYRLTLSNTGDGTCRELRIRAEREGPAAYARASFSVNGRRVRDAGGDAAVFGDGIVLEDVPVGAAISCCWQLCVDPDVHAAATVVCRAILAWDGEEERTIEAPVVGVVPARAFPTVAASLPARVPHAAIADAPPRHADAPERIHVAPAPYDAAARSRLRCDYLEGTEAVSGLVAVLDLRIFLPFAVDESTSGGDPTRASAVRAVVRAVDRIAIGMRLGVTLLRGDALVSDELRTALAAYREELRVASTGAIVGFIAEELASVEAGAVGHEALSAYLAALRSLIAWWATREDEIADLLVAELPPAAALARAALIGALAGPAARAVA